MILNQPMRPKSLETIDFFESAFEATIDHEGGYSDHSNDRGGKTNWGITQKVAREFGYDGDMLELPKYVAKRIYRQNYWDRIRGDIIADYSPAIACELFDTSVNCGVGFAAKSLQTAVNLMNRNQTKFPDIKVDGGIGKNTLHSMKMLSAKYERERLYVALNGEQYVRYKHIVEASPDQEVFFTGWLGRISLRSADQNIPI